MPDAGSEALFWSVTPIFFDELALFSTVLGTDRQKLSKRHGATAVSSFRQMGYLPEALANYLAGILEELLKGTSFPLYWFLVGSSLGAGVVLLLITPLIRKLMHGRG